MRLDAYRISIEQIAGISPLNVRQADEADDLTSLKATIVAAGLINPILLHQGDDGRAYVLAGGRRYRALLSILKDDPDFSPWLAANMASGASEAELRALSTMENTQTLAMHPVRQFEAFAAIAAAFATPEAAEAAIAKEFGLDRRAVRQRLALGKLSPKIRAAWLAGEISAEAARAYAESDDVAAQEAYFDDPARGRVQAPAAIRRALLADFYSGDAAIVRFVGEAAYCAAGGRIVDSLFVEERHFSKALVDRLARGKLFQIADALKTAEGWGFFVLQGDDGEDDFEQIDGEIADYLADEAARKNEIEALLREGQARGALASDGSEALKFDALFAEWDALEARATNRALSMTRRLDLGVFVGFDFHGRRFITRAVAASAGAPAAAPIGDQDDDEAEESPQKAKRAKAAPIAPAAAAEPIPKKIRDILDETIAEALQSFCGGLVNAALCLFVASAGCLAPAMVASARIHAQRGFRPRSTLLRAIEKLSFSQALPLASRAPFADVTVAACELVGASLDPSRADGLAELYALLAAIAPLGALDRAVERAFDPKSYFLASSREACLSALREIDGEAAAGGEAQGLKLAALRERVAILAQDRAWLPAELRRAVTAADRVEAAAIAPAPRDDRSTADAMLDALEADEAFGAAPPDRDNDDGAEQDDDDDADGEFSQDDDASAAPESAAAISRRVDRARLDVFIAQACSTGADAGKVKLTLLLDAFNLFAEAKGWAAIPSVKILSELLRSLGFAEKRAASGLHFVGLSLRDADLEAAQ